MYNYLKNLTTYLLNTHAFFFETGIFCEILILEWLLIVFWTLNLTISVIFVDYFSKKQCKKKNFLNNFNNYCD